MEENNRMLWELLQVGGDLSDKMQPEGWRVVWKVGRRVPGRRTSLYEGPEVGGGGDVERFKELEEGQRGSMG